ncbi:MAG: hypothetical protein EBZ77_10955, partial [Chitinophagia bacterium]|nr:hypothetical protein [Chitinophagia bacterium]
MNQLNVEQGSVLQAKVSSLISELLAQHQVPCLRVDTPAVAEGEGAGNLQVVRVVTYFEANVGAIAALLKGEFGILADAGHSNTGNQVHKPVHFLAQLSAARQAMPEYHRVGDTVFELQICSVLQDAWRSLETGIGLAAADCPESLKLDLARVGAWLEMVDVEYTRIKAIADTIEPAAAKPAPAAEQASAEPVTEEYEDYFKTSGEGTPAYMNLSYNYNTGKWQNATTGTQATVEPQPVVAPLAQEPATEEALEEETITMVAEPTPVIADEPIVAEELQLTNDDHISEEVFPAYQETATQTLGGLELQEQGTDEGKISLATLDMNVARPENLSMQVNNVEQPEEGELTGLLDQASASFAQLQSTDDSVEVPATGGVNNESVALNIDNIETFNLNVNGLVEHRTEIIRDGKEEDNRPFFEKLEKPNKPIVLDENTLLSDATLREYVVTSTLVKQVDAEIARRAGAVLNSEVDVEGDVERLKYLKVFTIKQLHERIEDNMEDVVAFAEKWIGTDNGGSFDSG